MTAWYRFKKRNNRRSRLAMFVWWTLVPWLLIPLGRLIWGFRIHHRRRCPEAGPVLAICNHQTMLDPALAGLALHERGFRPLARKTLVDDLNPLVVWAMSRYDVVPLDTTDPGPSSFRAILEELRSGRVAILFPEGARSEDGTVQPFQQGLWLLIRKGRAPVLPMAVEGVIDVMPRGSGLRRQGRFELIVGEPIDAELLIEMGRERALEHLQLAVDDLRMKLRGMIRQRSGGRWPLPGPADHSLRTTPGGPDLATEH